MEEEEEGKEGCEGEKRGGGGRRGKAEERKGIYESFFSLEWRMEGEKKRRKSGREEARIVGGGERNGGGEERTGERKKGMREKKENEKGREDGREKGRGGEQIARIVGHYKSWFAPGRIWPEGRCEGVALLIRDDIEVLAHSVEALTLDRDDPFERESQRIVLRAAIRPRGAEVVDVLVTHLSLSRQARARTARELLDFAARERGKSGSVGAVLMGDLNAGPSEEAIAIIEADGGFVDAWRHVHPAARGGTWPAGVPLRRIDYVFVQPGEGWSIVGCERTPFSGSDHLGVAARIHMGSGREGA